MEKFPVVAASDKDANHLFVPVKGGPDRGTMSPIKEPCRVSTLSTPGIIFLGKVGPPRRLTRRARPAVPYPARLLPAPRRAPVCLSCWAVLIFLLPARCSRDTAIVAVFRLASSHPQPETLPRGYPNDCPSLSRAGGAKREAGRGRSGPNERREYD